MHSEAPVNGWTIYAYEYTVRHAGPGRIFGVAVKAYLEMKQESCSNVQNLHPGFEYNILNF